MAIKKASSRDNLRKKAESQLAKKSRIKGREIDLSSYEGKKLVHELQVHQIELELQNEELVRAQADILDSQRRYADLFNFAPIGYIVLDFEGMIRETNRTAIGMLGETKRMIMGRPFSFYVHTSDRVVFGEHIRQAFSSPERTTSVVRLKRKGGGFLHTQLESARFEAGSDQLPGCMTAITDISRLKELEGEREAYIRDLEAFGYTASHELRSSLVSIGGMARILGEDYPSCLDEKGRQYLEIIVNSTKRMERLLADILEFSRVSTKEISVDTIDPGVLARSAYGDIAPDPAQRRVKLKVGPLPAAKGDPAMIRQVFVNLLSNALKFTEGRDEAVIEVRGEKGGEENIYSVRDNGVGFHMEYAHKLFTIFQRLHSSREFPGTGAGLSIVRRIVEKHGGRVWANGKPNGGATFYFSLPAA